MPDSYHYTPREFRDTSRPEIQLNPHFTYEKSPTKGAVFYPDLHDSRTLSPCQSLLLHRVPSASLYPEEMLAQWSSSQSNSISRYSSEGTERSSNATLVDFGDWVSGQSHDRPLSLLPPAPQLNRLPPSDAGRVECRLSSSTTQLSDHTTKRISDQSTTPEQLHDLSTQLQEVSFSRPVISPPPTRPITPVPSLTTSDYSRSSFGTESSTCTMIGSPYQQLLSTPLSPSAGNMGMSIGKPFEGVIYGSRIHNVSSPPPSLPDHRNGSIDRVNLRADASRGFPYRPTPIRDMNATAIHLPQSPKCSQEVSFIEWDDDDDRYGKSALCRIKKSFTDLRAAERYITEASTRSRTQAMGTAHEAPTSAARPRLSDTGSGCDFPPVVTLEQRRTNTQTPTKLRKKASTKNLSKSARSSNTAPPTPPSIGKRKRADTLSSQRSRDVQKKTKNGLVEKFVRAFTGARKEHLRD
ncbi:hypothetical protein PV04_02072 [Phialophora macrospora]|uniref:Uncharacterized protein n=1 Tax=Phialophora macrospora TaxID=1851006 RepID=A0A0D2G5I7_9EURO|nr:hypothetical protein PV04_02072 [Phialophora macrospora]